jgi:tRNA pseudouridine38-40 synthase
MLSAVVTREPEMEVSAGQTTKVVLVVEYDGTRYHGFQLQGKLPTIQKELEKAVEALTGENRRIMTASRTDTGVHARAQVVSFRTESAHSNDTFVKGLNYYLPKDIAVRKRTGSEIRSTSGVAPSAANINIIF